MEIDKKPNQEKTIENSEKNILFRFPIFNKTKPYLWLKAVLPEKDEYQDIYRIAFNASFFKTLNINVRVFREDLHLLEPYFKTDIDKIKSFVMVLPNQKHMFVNKVETILQLNVVNPTKDHTESIDYLKIDKSFIDDSCNSQGKVFIETIVKMGQTLNMKIVAEGVETQEQVEYLKSISCNLYQGYYFSKPIKAKELEEFYKSL